MTTSARTLDPHIDPLDDVYHLRGIGFTLQDALRAELTHRLATRSPDDLACGAALNDSWAGYQQALAHRRDAEARLLTST